jgi:two-component system phosphate regulon response regulator PhoB
MASGSKRVLIVEDDPALALVIRYRLSKAGFELLHARDGQAAWQAAQREHFDMVITDEQMPEMTGTQLCLKLRADPRYAHIPIVMVTAKAMEMELSHVAELLGLAALVTKPFSPNRLAEVVENCLAGAAAVA